LLRAFAVFVLAFAATAAGTDRPSPTPAVTHREDVLVSRVVVNTHVLNPKGNPIGGLEMSDFRVEIDGHGVPLEAADWIESPTGPPAAEAETTPSGRLIILLFQWEIAHQKQEGFIRMQRQAMSFVSSLSSEDRVAVALHSSRLWLLQDFTSDHAQVAAALASLLNRRSEPVPSLWLGCRRVAADLSEPARRLRAQQSPLRAGPTSADSGRNSRVLSRHQ
jgi:hypothetical protein